MGVAAVKAQQMSGYRCWLRFYSTFICTKMGIGAKDKERLSQAVIKKKNLLVTQYNLYCLYDSYMVFWRVMFMNNNGGSGNVGGSTQWRVKQRAFCFTVISSVVRHFGIL